METISDMIKEYISPELVVLIPVLYFIGMALKHSKLIKDKFIPVILGIISVVLALLWVLTTCEIESWQTVLTAIFTAATQGVIAAGTSVYCDQLVKQAEKDDDDETEDEEIDDDEEV